MIDREHDLPITEQAEMLKISRGSVYYLPRPVSADLELMRLSIGCTWSTLSPVRMLRACWLCRGQDRPQACEDADAADGN